MRDKKGKFNDLIENRVDLNPDYREGLRDAILTNQTLKALVYIEKIFDSMDTPATVEDKPQEQEEPAPKKATRAKSSSAKSTSDDKDSTETND